jgi:hypothetical protein
MGGLKAAKRSIVKVEGGRGKEFGGRRYAGGEKTKIQNLKIPSHPTVRQVSSRKKLGLGLTMMAIPVLDVASA